MRLKKGTIGIATAHYRDKQGYRRRYQVPPMDYKWVFRLATSLFGRGPDMVTELQCYQSGTYLSLIQCAYAG